MSLIFISNTPYDLRAFMSNILSVQSLPVVGEYLGLNLDFSWNKTHLFTELNSKVVTQIEKWRSSTISVIGRVILAKHVLCLMPQYTLAMFCLLSCIASTVDQYIAHFIWAGHVGGQSIHWKSWSVLTMSKLHEK